MSCFGVVAGDISFTNTSWREEESWEEGERVKSLCQLEEGRGKHKRKKDEGSRQREKEGKEEEKGEGEGQEEGREKRVTKGETKKRKKLA